MTLWGGIEAGGTKFICALARASAEGSGPAEILAEERIATTSPAETIARSIAFFERQQHLGALSGVGISSFGPVDPSPSSATFGFITTTPKAGWANTDFAGAIRRALGVPVGFDTDVNGAALGEHRWGAAQGLDTFIYLTIGTGIGGGGLVNGQLMHGLLHPEMGHIRIPRDHVADPFEGACPYHGDCLEGLASGPAMEARWACAASDLPDEHAAWALEAHYLALAVNNFILTLSPQRVILGGGVMDRAHLLPMVRREVLALLNEYVQAPAILEGIDAYIVSPGLGNRAGVLGAIALAMQAAG